MELNNKEKRYNMTLIKFLLVVMSICFGNVNTVYSREFSSQSIREMGAGEIAELLNHEDWEVRYDAIVNGVKKFRVTDERGTAREFVDTRQAEIVQDALIQLLKREIELAKKGELPGPEVRGYGDYLGEVVVGVTYIKDEKALPVLIDTIGGKVGGGASVGNAIADFGEPAVVPLINKLTDQDIPDRFVAASILGQILIKDNNEEMKISNKSRNIIKNALINSIKKDENPLVKRHAIRGLSQFEDEKIIALLENLTNKDLYSQEKSTATIKRMERVYRLQDEARKAIEKIRQRQEKENDKRGNNNK